jgi:hypothetical protein
MAEMPRIDELDSASLRRWMLDQASRFSCCIPYDASGGKVDDSSPCHHPKTSRAGWCKTPRDVGWLLPDCAANELLSFVPGFQASCDSGADGGLI